MAQYRLYRPWAGGPWGNSFEALRREMDALFHRFDDGSPPTSEWRGAFPAVNLYETADGYTLMAELPGVAPGDVHVSLEGTTLVLQGERKIDEATSREVSVHRRERRAGTFRRAFELPTEIDVEKAGAEHRNGVLVLRLPKTAKARPRQIPVAAS